MARVTSMTIGVDADAGALDAEMEGIVDNVKKTDRELASMGTSMGATIGYGSPLELGISILREGTEMSLRNIESLNAEAEELGMTVSEISGGWVTSRDVEMVERLREDWKEIARSATIVGATTFKPVVEEMSEFARAFAKAKTELSDDPWMRQFGQGIQNYAMGLLGLGGELSFRDEAAAERRYQEGLRADELERQAAAAERMKDAYAIGAEMGEEIGEHAQKTAEANRLSAEYTKINEDVRRQLAEISRAEALRRATADVERMSIPQYQRRQVIAERMSEFDRRQAVQQQRRDIQRAGAEQKKEAKANIENEKHTKSIDATLKQILTAQETQSQLSIPVTWSTEVK